MLNEFPKYRSSVPMSQRIHAVDLITEYSTSNPEDSNIQGQYRKNVKAHSVYPNIYLTRCNVT
jgi:hypothetical protein